MTWLPVCEDVIQLELRSETDNILTSVSASNVNLAFSRAKDVNT
jgi:hypothetical protein